MKRVVAIFLLGVATATPAATPATPPPPATPAIPAPPPAPTVPAAPARPTAPATPAAPTVPAAPAQPVPPAPPGASTKAAKAHTPESVMLTGPSVVIFHASRAEVTESAKSDPEPSEETLAERKDFQSGASKLEEALKAHPQIKVIVSSADVVRFSDPKVPPVWRYSVGSGYVFYQPGKPLRVFSGGRAGEGLICEAWRMFDTKPKPPHCDR